ncbi:MAG: hypothetical protein RII27_08490, partial [Alphaproteobacteria bacterium]
MANTWRALGGLTAGLVFGFGLSLSQMTDPAKVLNFLDVSGAWDPSLALVLAGAVAVAFIGYRLVWRRPAPLFDVRFHLPERRDIDPRLLSGAAIFGIGWGLVGLCPGPAIAGLAAGRWPSFVFVGALIGGMLLWRAYDSRTAQD